jgi:hypothetical protein
MAGTKEDGAVIPFAAVEKAVRPVAFDLAESRMGDNMFQSHDYKGALQHFETYQRYAYRRVLSCCGGKF